MTNGHEEKLNKSQPDLHAASLTFETRLSPTPTAFALLADAGLALDLEAGFKTGAACARALVFDTGFAAGIIVCTPSWVLEAAFALAFALALGASCLVSPLTA
jgi:hypothetical protein